jgi:hypothetical protein
MTDIRTPLRHRWIRVIAAPVGVVAAQPSAADGADTDGDDTDADDTDMADYRSCLEENGVTMPEPPGGGGGVPPQGGTPPSGAPAAGGGPGGVARQAPPGVDGDTWAAAQEACADLAPTPPDGSAPTADSGT